MLNTAVSTEVVQRRTKQSKSSIWNGAFLILLSFILVSLGCTKDENVVPANLDNRGEPTTKVMGYEVTNLVSDVAEYHPNIIDPNLVNAWGMAISPTGVFWISAAETELSVIYNDEGETLRKPVTMEGDPTGQVMNRTSGFVIPGVGPAKFIFVTEYGSITAWASGDVATTMVDRTTDGSSFTGVELANDGTGNYLYVANNGTGTIDVYDENWNLTDKRLMDPSLPPEVKPFNVRLINGVMYVTYTSDRGGFVNIFKLGGGGVGSRFASLGALNAPWGITNAPAEFGLGDAILIGNFGDGKINIYNSAGQLKGQLMDEDGMPIVIEGLWALGFTPGAFAGTSDPDLYFTAGPDNEEHGIFGEIEPPE